MNRDLALTPEEGAWPVQPYDPATQLGRSRDQSQMLDLPTLLRIVREWRSLILGCAAGGLALAIAYALLTTPMYRAWVLFQVNPPAVEILDEKTPGAEAETPWDFVATQVGLLSSRTLAERVAQDLNLVNKPEFVDLAALTRSIEAHGGYGYGYGYGYKYGKVGHKRTEIALIPDQSDA